MFQFDPATHSYSIAGRKVYSVTGVLKRAGLIADTWYTPEAAERGTFVHKACELWDHGILDEDDLDDGLRGYLDAWKAYREMAPCTFDVIEQEGYSEQYMFAGKLDRRYMTTIVEIKTGSALPPWLDLQLAAYSILFPAKFGRGVLLRPTGTFKAVSFDESEMAQARGRFLEALKGVQTA